MSRGACGHARHAEETNACGSQPKPILRTFLRQAQTSWQLKEQLPRFLAPSPVQDLHARKWARARDAWIDRTNDGLSGCPPTASACRQKKAGVSRHLRGAI